MSNPFDDLEKILKEQNLHVTEEEKDKQNIKPFTFYKELNYPTPGSAKVGNRFLERIGIIIYCPKTNESGIDWDGTPPELVIMGLNGYIKEIYNKEPDYYILTRKGKLREYKIIKA